MLKTDAPIVRCERLCLHYPGNLAPVLSNLNLVIEPGTFVAILGRSGSGKSTLLHLLGAMDKPSSGILEVGGVDLTRISEAEQSACRRRSLGFIFQSYNLMPMLDVRQNLALPLELNRMDKGRHVESRLESLGLTHCGHRYPDQLSGGEQQRVAIGRALIHGPALVLADEPTGNLDLETSSTVLALFRDLIRANRSTVVMATHSLEAAGFADRVLKLVGGQLTAVH